ncbi:hypothetical protein N0V90_003475 [Kalmusia sp. IMI 367209]|nr:hypothetical protein N0V90_003475 [Kalmusia sp. IMI 367209]
MCGTDCFLMFLSLLFPPIGVWVKRGICSADSLINLALLCLGFLPGVIHAWYIILNNPEHDYEHVPDHERQGGTTRYYIVAHGGPAPHGGNGQMHYGTVGSQPTGGQFPGQQTGTTNAFAQPKPNKSAQPQQGVAGQEIGGGQGSSEQPNGPPPTYADVIKGDHKVQKP